MKIHRFVVNNISQSILNNQVILDCPEIIWQISKVLRLKPLDKVILIDGKGLSVFGQILELHKSNVLIEIDKTDKYDNSLEISVGLPLIKLERFEWALEKLTEFGITNIYPIFMHYSRFKPQDFVYDNKKVRWQKIIKEALEQSGGFYLPEIHQPMKFENFLKIYKENSNDTKKFFLDINSDVPKLIKVLYNTGLSTINKYVYFVGCEGGITSDESKMALSLGFDCYSLGDTILRVETAAIFVTGIIKNLEIS